MRFLSKWMSRMARAGGPFFAVWVLGGAAGAGFIILCGLVLWDGRRDAERQADQDATNIVRSIEQDIARNIELYDLSLKGVIEALNEPEVADLTGRARQMALFDNAATATYMNAIRVIDETGKVVESSVSRKLDSNLADRDYFRVHKDNPDVGMYLSEPLRNHQEAGEWIIAISRRISKPDGTFGGVVFGTLELSYFQNLFEKMSISHGSSISLFRRNGTLVTRRPFQLTEIGKNFSNIAVFQHYPEEQYGHFVSGGFLDNVQRRFTFGQIGNLPLVVSVGFSINDIYAPWRQKSLAIGVLMAGLLVTILAFGLLLTKTFKQRNKADALVRVSEARYRLLADNSTDAIVLRSLEGVRSYASPAFYHLLGRSPEEVGDKKLVDFLHPGSKDTHRVVLEKLRSGEQKVLGLLQYQHPDGTWRWLETISTPIYDENHAVMEIITNLRDVTRRKNAEDALILAAETDGMTGLANRRAFDEKIASEMSRAIRTQSNIAILMVDVDNFKKYNDALGHLAGDEAIKEVAAHLKSNIRRPPDFAARYGGEEFVVVLPDTDIHGALRVAENIHRAVAERALAHPNSPVGVVTISVGVASMQPKLGDDISSFIQAADDALYQAKKNGRNRVEQATPELRHKVVRLSA